MIKMHYPPLICTYLIIGCSVRPIFPVLLEAEKFKNLFCFKNKHGVLSAPDPMSHLGVFLMRLVIMPRLFCIFYLIQGVNVETARLQHRFGLSIYLFWWITRNIHASSLAYCRFQPCKDPSLNICKYLGLRQGFSLVFFYFSENFQMLGEGLAWDTTLLEDSSCLHLRMQYNFDLLSMWEIQIRKALGVSFLCC